MAYQVEFIKADTVNDEKKEVGSTMSVSDSIYKDLKEKGSVKDFVEKKPKPKAKED